MNSKRNKLESNVTLTNSINGFTSPVLLVLTTVVYLYAPFRSVQFLCLLYVLLWVFSELYSYTISHSLKISRIIQKVRIARGERFEILLNVENFSFLPVSLCFIKDTPGSLSIAAESGRTILSLKSHERKVFRYTLMGSSRGEFEVGPVFLTASDPLHFFPFTLKTENFCTVLVRPSRINTNSSPKPDTPQGLLKTQNICFEDITSRRSVRPYTTGDELKRVNQRLFAKTGTLWTNEYDDTYNCPFFVLLNLASDDYDIKTRFEASEKAIEMAASVVEKAGILHQKCGFASYSTSMSLIPPANGNSEFILDLLATENLEKGSYVGSELSEKLPLHIKHNTLFFYAGPNSTCPVNAIQLVESVYQNMGAGK